MTRQLQVEFKVDGHIREDKDAGCFVSYCPALDLYSAGKTRPEAKQALRGAIDLYIRLCFEREILGRVLHQRGFKAVADGLGLPSTESGEAYIAVAETATDVKYDDIFELGVPLNLIATQRGPYTPALVAAPCRP